MAAWPELDELKQVLDVESSDWDGDYDGTRLTRLLASAIEKVKLRRRRLGRLRRRPDGQPRPGGAPHGGADRPQARDRGAGRGRNDPTYLRLIFGHRRAFGVA